MNKKVNEIKENFLKETISDIWDFYNNLLLNDSIETWNWIVLTASNENQAKIYEKEINYRKAIKKIPLTTNYLVVADPEGKRVGSGGATLNVLNEIKKRENKNFDSLKILIIHSGGDSKRVPQYSVCGKLFSPVQRELPDGRTSTLFDETIITFSAIPSRMSPGVLVLSGDVLLVFNPLQVDMFHLDSAAISIKESAEIGQNHGVFLSNSENELLEFLHKQKTNVLIEKKAVNSSGNVDIDTGAIYLSSNVINKLYTLISTEDNFNQYVNEEVNLNLYGDFIYPLAKNATIENYLKQETEAHDKQKIKTIRKELWNILSNYNLKVIKTAPSLFIHFGTTKELLNLVSNKITKFNFLNWKRLVLTNIINNVNYSTNTAYIDKNATIEADAFIEKSYIGANCRIGKNTILSNVIIDNIEIPDNVCLNTFKQKNGTFVTRIYSVNDNPKKSIILGKSLNEILNHYGMDDKEIWENNETTLWNARIYPEEPTILESIKSTLFLQEIINLKASKNQVKNYLQKKRESLKTSFNNCDSDYMKIQAEEIERKIRIKQCVDLARNKENLNTIKTILSNSLNIEKQVEELLNEIKTCKHSIKYRIYLILSDLVKSKILLNYSSSYFEDRCYEEIRKATNVLPTEIQNSLTVKDKVVVELPIRINFARRLV